MKDDEILRAEAAARFGWRSHLAAALVAQLCRKYQPKCQHDWRAIAGDTILCIKSGTKRREPIDVK